MEPLPKRILLYQRAALLFAIAYQTTSVTIVFSTPGHLVYR